MMRNLFSEVINFSEIQSVSSAKILFDSTNLLKFRLFFTVGTRKNPLEFSLEEKSVWTKFTCIKLTGFLEASQRKQL